MEFLVFNRLIKLYFFRKGLGNIMGEEVESVRFERWGEVL